MTKLWQRWRICDAFIVDLRFFENQAQHTRYWPNCTVHHESVHQNVHVEPTKWMGTTKKIRRFRCASYFQIRSCATPAVHTQTRNAYQRRKKSNGSNISCCRMFFGTLCGTLDDWSNRCWTACHRRLRLHRLWRPSALDSKRFCLLNYILTFG